VKTKSVSGNAVVAIKKDNGDIVWSYHIWVTDYDATDESKQYTNTYNTNNNGSHFVFMDRNLGATQAGLLTSEDAGANFGFGLFYQWGRKDPFPATGNPGDGTFTAEDTSSSNGTITYTLQHPNTFLTASNDPKDWHYAFRDDELWGHSDVKTIYDPCPSGWRVPVNSGTVSSTNPWKGFTEGNGIWGYGYDWGANALYPAAGLRVGDSGSIGGEGVFGAYWTASPSSLFYDYGVSFMAILSGIVGIDFPSSTGRVNSSSVRCVKE
jgi:hypothetical protein